MGLLSNANRWLNIKWKSDGQKFYVVPGGKGKGYWTNPAECTCPDHTRRSVRCKHIIAVALHVSRVNTARRLAPRPTVRVPLVARLSA